MCVLVCAHGSCFCQQSRPSSWNVQNIHKDILHVAVCCGWLSKSHNKQCRMESWIRILGSYITFVCSSALTEEGFHNIIHWFLIEFPGKGNLTRRRKKNEILKCQGFCQVISWRPPWLSIVYEIRYHHLCNDDDSIDSLHRVHQSVHPVKRDKRW